MRKRTTIFCQLLLATLLVLPQAVFAQESGGDIEKILTRQSEAWNKGDILGFMETYWKDERMTFSSGGEMRRGWQATLDRYKSSYPKEKMGQLRFDQLEVISLGTDSAFATGDWHLDLNGEKKDGNFSLVLRKIGGAWKIVHDHSSVIQPKKEE